MSETSRSSNTPVTYDAWPELTFWYGLTPAELAHTPNEIILHYLRKLPGLKADAQMMAVEASVYPHLKKSDQSKIMRNLQRMHKQYSKQTAPAPRIDTAAGLEAYGGMGIGVEVVDA